MRSEVFPKVARKIWRSLSAVWEQAVVWLRPGPAERRLALLGAIAAPVVFGIFTGWTQRSGLGTWIDVLLGLVVGVIAPFLVGFLFVFVLLAAMRVVSAIFELFPKLLIAVVLGSISVLSTLLALSGIPSDLSNSFCTWFVPLQAVLCGAVGTLIAGTPRSGRRVALALVCIAFAAAVDVWLVSWLAAPGAGSPSTLRPQVGPLVAGAPRPANPAAPGPYKVKTLFYGSGNDKRRPEYGAAVDLRTRPVDLSALVPGYEGIVAASRTWFWGFGPHALPLNGRVWMPAGPGPFPLVLMVHGNAPMESFSDPGFAYLGKLLASRGFIAVSIDENFFNYTWSGDLGDEMVARAWLLLEHLRAWHDWNRAPGNPFSGKVDLDRVALMGQSRGGEAAAVAAALTRLTRVPDDASVMCDFHFPIRAVIAIAPSDNRYMPGDHPLQLAGVDYLVLQGSQDSDETVFKGVRQYRRTDLAGAKGYRFKAAVYAEHANHSRFNTSWGESDYPPPRSWLLERGSILTPEQQRRLAEVYLSGFLEASLREDRAYLPLFRDPGFGDPWLPNAVRLTQFQDSTYLPLATFEEDHDVTTATEPGATLEAEGVSAWREQAIRFRNGFIDDNHAVYLGWGDRKSAVPAVFTLRLPDSFAASAGLGGESRLTFIVADAGEGPGTGLDFTLELVDGGGRSAALPLSRVSPVPGPLRSRFSKSEALERQLVATDFEVHFQTYSIPLSAFAAERPGLDPTTLRTVRLRFDRTPKGTLVLDDVGFAAESRAGVGAPRSSRMETH